MKKMIIPAIIAKKQDELEMRVNKVKDYFNLIKLDLMDGKFVPNTSIDFDFKLPYSECRFEAHLMVNDPVDWTEKHYDKVDTILAHLETVVNPQRLIDIVKEKNKKIGFVLNPETSVQKLDDYLDQIDQVLIMTVNPGFYGSPFLPDMVDKIRYIRNRSEDIDIEVDGGITDKTISVVDKAGANMFVSGSYIVKSKDIRKAIDNLKKVIR